MNTMAEPPDALSDEECQAIGADGRDGRGYVAESNLTFGETRALKAYRETVRDLLPRLPAHEADVLLDDLVELAAGDLTRAQLDRDVAWASVALEPDADERARRQAEYDDANGDPLPSVSDDPELRVD